jgi:hypothetical protein
LPYTQSHRVIKTSVEQAPSPAHRKQPGAV